MIGNQGAWLPSVYVWIPVLAVICLLLVGYLVLVTIGPGWRDKEYNMISGPGLAGVFAAVALVGTAGTTLAGYYPYEGDYHRLQPATGVVKSVDSRFLAASQYVVVTYSTGLTVRCDDSRCATVKAGEELTLLCTKEHQLGSPLEADGWGCRWGQW